MNKSHIRAYTKALQESIMHRQSALEVELAVGFAVIWECDNVRRLARETLITIYNAAGWQCTAPGAIDWRAVNRRISASLALYDFFGVDIATLAEGKKAQDLVDSFRPAIAAMKVKSVNEVLLACEKVRAPRKPGTPQPGVRVDAGHMHVIVPPSATPEDLLAMSKKLMDMAQTMFEVRQKVEEKLAA